MLIARLGTGRPVRLVGPLTLPLVLVLLATAAGVVTGAFAGVGQGSPLLRAPAAVAADRAPAGGERRRDRAPGARRARVRGRSRGAQGGARPGRRGGRRRPRGRGRDDHLLRADRQLAGAARHPRRDRRRCCCGLGRRSGCWRPRRCCCCRSRCRSGARSGSVPRSALCWCSCSAPGGSGAGCVRGRGAAHRGGLGRVVPGPGRGADRGARPLAGAFEARAERAGPLPDRRGARTWSAEIRRQPITGLGLGVQWTADPPAAHRTRERSQLHARRRAVVVAEARDPGPGGLPGGDGHLPRHELAGVAAQHRPAAGRRLGLAMLCGLRRPGRGGDGRLVHGRGLRASRRSWARSAACWRSCAGSTLRPA